MKSDISKVTIATCSLFEALAPRAYLEGAAKSFADGRWRRSTSAVLGREAADAGVRHPLPDGLPGRATRTSRFTGPEHNLDRCRTQMALVESIEAQMDEMKAVVDRY